MGYYYSLRGLRYTNEKDIPNNYLDIQLKKKSSYQHQIPAKHPSGAKSCLHTKPFLDNKEEMRANNECPIKCLDQPSCLIRSGNFDDVKLGELGSDQALNGTYNRGPQFSIQRWHVGDKRGK